MACARARARSGGADVLILRAARARDCVFGARLHNCRAMLLAVWAWGHAGAIPVVFAGDCHRVYVGPESLVASTTHSFVERPCAEPPSTRLCCCCCRRVVLLVAAAFRACLVAGLSQCAGHRGDAL